MLKVIKQPGLPIPSSEYNMFTLVWKYMEGFKNGGK